ncbi:MAG TPA: porin [Steroidobacteraceae bacterium]
MTHHSTTQHSTRAALWLMSALFAAGTVTAAEPASKAGTEQQQIDALAQQLQAVQAQLRQLAEQNQALLQKLQQDEQRVSVAERQTAATPVPPAVPGQAPVPTQSAPPGAAAPMSASASAAPSGTSPFSNVRLWGYGELYYTRPSREPSKAQADLARAVFGIGYSFDAKTEFNSEFEVEHAVSSASDVGEFEVEQFYVDRQLSDAVTVRAGLFLMPFGLLNEHHEPTNFYGVQRNFVETLIIPSTWREGGFNVHGDTPIGISWNAGITTGFDLSKWDFAPEFPQYTTALDLENNGSAPLQSTHQELALANAHDLSQYAALGYFGLPGLTLGAAISTGKAVKVPAPPNAPILGDNRVTLWEAHARWTPAKFDLSALYAHGSISNLAGANASNPGSPNPIPSEFYGYFAQAAYGLWEQGDYRLAPFVRWEYYNMGSRYAGTTGPVIPAGLLPVSATPGDYGYWPRNHDRVWTVGANLYATPHVVLKADYQWFRLNSDFNRFDLGLGLNF